MGKPLYLVVTDPAEGPLGRDGGGDGRSRAGSPAGLSVDVIEPRRPRLSSGSSAAGSWAVGRAGIRESREACTEYVADVAIDWARSEHASQTLERDLAGLLDVADGTGSRLADPVVRRRRGGGDAARAPAAGVGGSASSCAV